MGRLNEACGQVTQAGEVPVQAILTITNHYLLENDLSSLEFPPQMTDLRLFWLTTADCGPLLYRYQGLKTTVNLAPSYL